MIIANIIGGLGNQMFQYAAIKALSLRRGWQLKLCTSEFENYKLHDGFELSRLFPMDEEIAAKAEVRERLGIYASPLTQKLVGKLHIQVPACRCLVIEPHYEFWPELNDASDGSYFRGYWQSPRYFQDKEAEIREIFKFGLPLDDENRRYLDRMQAEQSVSLHVRRGDYVKKWQNRRRFSTCSIDYYARSIHYLRERHAGLTFYVLTDDPEWVFANLSPLIRDLRLIRHNSGASSFRDMQLMSCARHNVIANSSFSWWGAWLNARPGRTVIAPSRWFSNGQSSKDLVPPDWVRL